MANSVGGNRSAIPAQQTTAPVRSAGLQEISPLGIEGGSQRIPGATLDLTSATRAPNPFERVPTPILDLIVRFVGFPHQAGVARSSNMMHASAARLPLHAAMQDLLRLSLPRMRFLAIAVRDAHAEAEARHTRLLNEIQRHGEDQGSGDAWGAYVQQRHAFTAIIDQADAEKEAFEAALHGALSRQVDAYIQHQPLEKWPGSLYLTQTLSDIGALESEGRTTEARAMAADFRAKLLGDPQARTGVARHLVNHWMNSFRINTNSVDS